MSLSISKEDIQKWEREIWAPLLEGQDPKGDVGQLGGLALISADADRVRDYVFESVKLPEIRGASMLLDDLNQGWPEDEGENLRKVFSDKGFSVGRENEKGCVVYAGGGSFLAVVPKKIANELQLEIERLYPRETGVATISSVIQEVSTEQIQSKFDEVMARQRLLLRRAKDEKGLVPFYEAIPPARRCDSCDIRPAAGAITVPDLRWLCRSCHQKIQNSDKQKWIDLFLEKLIERQNSTNLPKYLNGFELADLREGERGKIKRAGDLSEIARASSDQKSIGLIYADGNGIGRQVEESKTVDEYKRKSEILQAAMVTAIVNALANHLTVFTGIERKVGADRSIRVNIHPFEIITIGGDDALLVVPGDKAVDVAVGIGESFESELSGYKELFRRATISAGVVVADAHNPVYFLRTLAEDLLKNAKRKAREVRLSDPDSAEGTLDFLILKSQSMLSSTVESLRRGFPWRITSKDEQAILTDRPYTWKQMKHLQSTAQVVNVGMGKTQLQAIRRFLREGRLSGAVSYAYQYARAPRRRRAIYWWVEREWGMGTLLGPWKRMKRKHGYDRYSTVWEDIYEVGELVQPLEESDWQDIQSRILEAFESEDSNAGRNWFKNHS